MNTGTSGLSQFFTQAECRGSLAPHPLGLLSSCPTSRLCTPPCRCPWFRCLPLSPLQSQGSWSPSCARSQRQTARWGGERRAAWHSTGQMVQL